MDCPYRYMLCSESVLWYSKEMLICFMFWPVYGTKSYV